MAKPWITLKHCSIFLVLGLAPSAAFSADTATPSTSAAPAQSSAPTASTAPSSGSSAGGSQGAMASGGMGGGKGGGGGAGGGAGGNSAPVGAIVPTSLVVSPGGGKTAVTDGIGRLAIIPHHELKVGPINLTDPEAIVERLLAGVRLSPPAMPVQVSEMDGTADRPAVRTAPVGGGSVMTRSYSPPARMGSEGFIRVFRSMKETYGTTDFSDQPSIGSSSTEVSGGHRAR